MNRNDREITDINEIEKIINNAKVIRVAVCENNRPYVVPLNFGYKEKCIYIHTSKKGMKIDILKNNNNVSFEVDCDHKLIKSDKACDFSMSYKSVVGFGRACFISDLNEKKQALDIIMAHYSNGIFDYSQDQLEKICIIRMDIESMTGKKS
ncbi:MAG TPA: pyridoxamine 5'-phosphate oxidase family protein [Methanofastidiosum sp.]|nr:pyridoxamine 5'-phosphate oxidase family protein [Methanofastidiosum sp.]HNU61426.1 pyridoxamine 5'-phosphate oxidase family protein [Methanofastidiosum sp.]HOI77734.1 pyridoxamine 5'-phosphate oxidase family protein [Methanofastidiosum sp.]